MVFTKMLTLFGLSSLMFTASAFEGYATPIDEIQGQRTRIEVSGRKYASCYGRDMDTRVRTEVEEATMTVDGDYLEQLLMDDDVYGLAIRGAIGHSGEVTHGLNPDEDSAGLASDYEVDVEMSFAGREFKATIVPHLFCSVDSEDTSESMVSQGAFDMIEPGVFQCSSDDVFFTITSLDSMFQALEVLPGEMPDLVVKVTARFTSVYHCTGGSDSLAIGRAELGTAWLSIFNVNEAICY